MTGTLHRDVCALMAISRLFLLRMRNVWTKFVEKIKTHLLCSKTFFFPEKHPTYEIMWKNKVEPDRAQMTIIIQHMRFACWLTKATDKHSEYVILIAFSRWQWLRERATMLHCTVRLVKFCQSSFCEHVVAEFRERYFACVSPIFTVTT